MKQKFYSFLLTALLGLFGMNAWAQTTYEISSALELAAFAQAVNGGETTANAVLTDDIDMSELSSWTAIGDWNTGAVTSAYCGHFDGQGHTITNFTFTSNKNYFGIFGVVSTGCLIENLIVEGTITTNIATAGVVGYARDATPTLRNIHSYLNINNTRAGSRLGGILGSSVNGTVVVDRCTYTGTLDGNDSGGSGNYGGIVGYVNNNANAHLRVTNCLFDGELKNTAATPGGCTFGGMVGYVGASPDVTITNCLSLGRLQSQVTGLFYGAVKHNTCSIVNSFYQKQDDEYTVNGSASTVTPTTQEVTEVDDAQLSSGEVCYLLNESVSGGTNWYQTLIDDEYPTPNGSDKVYANGSYKCDGVTPKENTDVTYSNSEESNIDPHTPANGVCSVCGIITDENYMTPNDEDYYEIGIPAQLKWFAAYVNQVDHAANAVLTADIALISGWTTPIGTGSGNVAPGATAYTGTFDGQGHAITGFNAEGVGHLGLFGDARGATIKNFSISGNLTVTGGYGGGVIAWPINSTIENVHATLAIDVPNSGVHHVGGVVGSARGGNTIDRCSFSGSLTVATGSTDNFAGIAGYITSGDNVTNCANYGKVTFKDASCAAGGVVGYLNSTSATIKNCLTVGTIQYDGEGDPKYGGAILGRTKGFTSGNITNNYWLEGSANGAARYEYTDSEKVIHYETRDVAPSVTEAQLASGNVASKLAPAFRQTIGTDDAPVLAALYPDHNVVAEISEVGYATLYVPDANVTIPEGVTAYTAQIAENEGNGTKYLAMVEVDGGILPEQTAVILKGDGGIYEFAVSTDEVIPEGALGVYGDAVDGSKALVKGLAAPFEENVLKGSAEDIDATGKYVLAKVNPETEGYGYPVAFCKAEGGILKAGKAYLELDASDVKVFFFSFDDATGINEVNGQWSMDNGQSIYNLAGQRIQKMQKGVNIVGGKKVMY